MNNPLNRRKGRNVGGAERTHGWIPRINFSKRTGIVADKEHEEDADKNPRYLFAAGYKDPSTVNIASCANVSQENLLRQMSLQRQLSDTALHTTTFSQGGCLEEEDDDVYEQEENDNDDKNKNSKQKRFMTKMANMFPTPPPPPHDDSVLLTQREADILDERLVVTAGFPPPRRLSRLAMAVSKSTRNFVDGLSFLAPNRRDSIETMVHSSTQKTN